MCKKKYCSCIIKNINMNEDPLDYFRSNQYLLEFKSIYDELPIREHDSTRHYNGMPNTEKYLTPAQSAKYLNMKLNVFWKAVRNHPFLYAGEKCSWSRYKVYDKHYLDLFRERYEEYGNQK